MNLSHSRGKQVHLKTVHFGVWYSNDFSSNYMSGQGFPWSNHSIAGHRSSLFLIRAILHRILSNCPKYRLKYPEWFNHLNTGQSVRCSDAIQNPNHLMIGYVLTIQIPDQSNWPGPWCLTHKKKKKKKYRTSQYLNANYTAFKELNPNIRRS